ncbi:hypothetical protein TTHERM_000522097 (macronuclear) [Tetrahymena thermophila SB210]|uniref:Uncharacterized protein n=1 Tax=Tetrahymena thermophila (strain SB210) TaxID=312017 RepID=W7XK79_TETTS|nr:hypothetical protein TTHERM_000522097 [Tetrahymena thermophila SB210]EWS74679.1 hypothetical protein TTHERM_000522097 [Tetrahymena thermophila SB210]|eukprot:XP_012652769.1 hypothetical protein TTHERM_000522097 [Tetrahymena thermophila SB210]
MRLNLMCHLHNLIRYHNLISCQISIFLDCNLACHHHYHPNYYYYFQIMCHLDYYYLGYFNFPSHFWVFASFQDIINLQLSSYFLFQYNKYPILNILLLCLLKKGSQSRA